MPGLKSDDDGTTCSSFYNQPVSLQHQRIEKYGTANQKWSFEKETGFMDAFSADVRDKGWLMLILIIIVGSYVGLGSVTQ